MFTALQDGNLGRILDKFSISSSVGYSLLKPYERFSVYISGFLYRVTDIFQKRLQHIYYWISPSFTSPHRLTVRWAVRPVSAFMLGTELANAEMKSVFLFKDGLISSASDQFANKCKGGRKCNGWVFSQDKGKTRNRQTQRNIRITGNRENDWTRRSDARKRMLPTINVEMLWLKVRKAFSWFPVISAHNLNLHTHTPVVHTSFLLMQLPSVDPS